MFHVGQKVVCVDDKLATRWLTKDQIYTISGSGMFLGAHLYDLAEVKTSVAHAWKATRFRPVHVRKTDISIFLAMLNKQPEKVG